MNKRINNFCSKRPGCELDQMPKSKKTDINEILLAGHKKGVERAIDISIRTGVPLVVEKNGKIIKVKPKYKYIKVPIKTKKSR